MQDEIRDEIRDFINIYKLPENMEFYSVDGTKVFRIANQENVWTSLCICYLIANKNFAFANKYGIVFSMDATLEMIKEKVITSIKDFQSKIESGSARIVNMDGGDLGLEE